MFVTVVWFKNYPRFAWPVASPAIKVCKHQIIMYRVVVSIPQLTMTIAAASAAIGAVTAPSSMAFFSRHRTKWVSLIPKSSFSSQSSPPKQLILYSKPGCCLCDGLKEKLQVAFSLDGPDSLHDVHLQVRDITSNQEWEKSYQYEIPVLARVLSDGTEATLPRLSPRLKAELIQKKIAAALRQE